MASHPKYELKQAKNGDYYFNLTAKNGHAINLELPGRNKAEGEQRWSEASCPDESDDRRETPLASFRQDCYPKLPT